MTEFKAQRGPADAARRSPHRARSGPPASPCAPTWLQHTAVRDPLWYPEHHFCVKARNAAVIPDDQRVPHPPTARTKPTRGPEPG